jgi:TolB-like protein
MTRRTGTLRSLVAEFRRRHVIRVAALYAAVAWLLIQAATTILPRLALPDWTITLVIVLTLFGFPIALVLAWSYDLTPDGVQRTDATTAAPPDPPTAAAPAATRYASTLALALVIVAAVGAGALLRHLRPAADGANAIERTSPGEGDVAFHSVAVLPFQNAGGGSDDEYLADGIAEELLHRLSRVPALQVAARTSSFAFRGGQADVREIGARLNVDVVLEGSVRSMGGRLRITARLVSTRDGYQLWSEVYEREAADVFLLQDEISAAIVQRLRPDASTDARAALAAAAAASPTAEPEGYEAFQLYLRGRHEWNRRTEDGLRSSVRFFEQAIARSPGYARAYHGLADALAVLGFYDYVPPATAFPQAREAAGQALRLDPGLTESHATLAYVALYHDYDVAGAETMFRRALEFNPRYAVAHQWYGNLLAVNGRFDEAVAAMRRAQSLDPLALIGHAAEGWVLMHARQYDRAAEHLRRVLERDSTYFLAQLWLGQALELGGRPADAVAVLRAALRTAPHSVLAQAALARALARAGDATEAHGILAALEARSGREYVASYEIAVVHAALGDGAAALARLERALDDRAHAIAFLDVDPRLDPLRGDPRFQRLVRRARGG